MQQRKKRLQKIQALSELSLPAESSASPKKKPKKRKPKDAAYNPSSESSGSSGKKGKSLGFRFNQKKTLTKDDGTQTPKKTSVLIRETPTKGLLDDKAIESMHKKIAETVPTHTPIKDIEFTETGTPAKVTSVSGKKLFLQSSDGVLYHYSNEKTKEEVSEFTIDSDFSDSSPAKRVIKPSDTKNTVSVVITTELLTEVAKEISANKGRRSVSQNKVKGASATDYTHAAGISADNKAEWGHLIAHRFLSDIAQHRDNLVAITSHANTDMMPIEDIISTLATTIKEPIRILATAYFIGETQIASKIEYTVEIGENKFPFVFKGQQLNKPDIANQLALKAFFNVLQERDILNKKLQNPPKALVAENPFKLFSKSAQAKQSKLKDQKTDKHTQPGKKPK